MTNKNSSHILSTSSNLLGFCLIVLTSLKISKYGDMSIMDEITGVACILLAASSFFSFLSIRTTKENLIIQYERMADIIFIVVLLLVFTISVMIAFPVIFR